MFVMTKKRSGSRHKDRHTVSLPGALYERLRKSAARHDRPINRQARRLLDEALTADEQRQAKEGE